MKTNHSITNRELGSTLVVTMTVVVVATLCLASYLILVQGQSASVARSQNWNTVIPVCEAGLEEGLAMVNLGAPDIISSPWAWTNSVTSNGWSGFTNGRTSLTRIVSGSNYYNVVVDISSGSPVITSTAVVSNSAIPWEFSSVAQPFVAAAGVSLSTAGNAPLGRKVQVQTVLNPLFSAAVITKSNFDMKGNNCLVDSYDSSNPLYSTAGQYNVVLRKAGGNVGTDSSIVGDLSIGNGNIYGHVMTGPGTQQNAVQVGSQGSVGDTAWNATHSGVEPGYWSGDFNVNVQDVSAPATGTASLPAAVGGVVTLSGGNYTISPSDPNIGKPITVTAPTTVWVQGSFSPAGITIASTNGAKLVLYVGRATGSGDSLGLSGNGSINQPGYPANLQLYGLPSLTSISFNGNAGFEGTIYAPEADMTGGGGGNNTLDTSGAMVVNSVSLNGHWNFHYDENLLVNGPSKGWVAKTWSELKYP